jgi:hypothetical protein
MWNASHSRELFPHVQQKKSRRLAVCPSWDPAIPQAMQQHGGRNRYPAIDPTKPANQTEPEPAAPRGTSLQIYPQPAVIPAEPR